GLTARSLDLHAGDDHVGGGTTGAVRSHAVRVDAAGADLLQDVHPAGDLAEHRVAARLVRGQRYVGVDEEELGAHALAVVAGARHRDAAGGVEVVLGSVLDRAPGVAGATGAGRRRVAALEQRPGHQSVARGAVVEALA